MKKVNTVNQIFRILAFTSLKDKYNPENILEDYLIEDILQRAFAEKYLVEQKAKSNYDLDSLYSIWKNRR